jgi:drug/metabolite transporter (DMT)-like permease
MASRDMKSGIILTVLASLIWGTSFPGIDWGLGFVGNDIFFLWIRFLIASAVTMSVVLYLKKFDLSVFREPIIWIIGGLNTAGFVLQYVGQTITNASKTSLLVDINIVAVAVISYFVFSERLGRKQLGGIVLGSFGVVLVASSSATEGGGLSFDAGQFLGDVLVYLAGWCWAFFIIVSKKTLARHGAVEISSGAIVVCTLMLVPAVAYLGLTGADFTMESNGWLAAAYLGVFCTSAAILLWAMGLEAVSATASATIMLIEIVTALVISYFWLDERLSDASFAGAVCVLAAVYLVASAPQEKTAVKTT